MHTACVRRPAGVARREAEHGPARLWPVLGRPLRMGEGSAAGVQGGRGGEMPTGLPPPRGVQHTSPAHTSTPRPGSGDLHCWRSF